MPIGFSIRILTRFVAGVALAGVALTLAGCGAPRSSHESTLFSMPQEDNATDLWNNYVARLGHEPIQPDCQPRRFPADPGVPPRGTIMLFHGFTACPQQYFEIAPTLAAAGFTVLLPLNPGHGRTFSGAEDDLSQLPDRWNWEAYQRFVDDMNVIMSAAQGERVVGGLSLGGTFSALAVARQPGLYHRQLLVTPHFKMAFDSLPRVFGNLPFTDQIMVGFGKECQVTERNNGRAGICNFRLTHVAAVQRIGEVAREGTSLGTTRTQIVGVTADKGVQNQIINDFIREARLKEADLSSCVYPTGVNHSLFSRFDSPQEDKFWIEPFLANAVTFLTEGTYFPSQGPSGEPEFDACTL